MTKFPNANPPLDPRDSALNENPTAPDSMNSDIGSTGGPTDPVNKGDRPIPQELTGRAAGTGEDLLSLFSNRSDEHLTDGFRAGNGDDPDTDVERTDDQAQIDR